MNISIKKNRLVDIVLLILYSLCVIFTINPTLNKLSLIILIPTMGMVIFFRNKNVYFENKYTFLFLLLIVWMLITSFLAENIDVAFRQMIRNVSAYILSVISFYIASRNKNCIWLYILMLIYMILLLYSASSGSDIVIVQEAKDREQFEEINANSFGYFLYYMSFATIILLYIKKLNNIFIIIIALIFIAFLSFYIALITASRQILIIQLPFMCLILFTNLKYNAKNVILLMMLFIAILLYGLPIINEIYSNSFLAIRSETNITEDSRYYLLMKGLEEGIKHPIFGLGLNNFVLKYGQFTHCSYTELFACSGLPALFLYLSIIYRFISKNISMYRKTKDKIFSLFVIFGLIFSLYNFFYVFVGNLWLMGFFYVILGHSENYCRYYCKNG